MNNLPYPYSNKPSLISDGNMQIVIERFQLDLCIVDRAEKGWYSPWITAAQENLTCSVSAIVTRHLPTVNDVLSLIDKVARSNLRRDTLLPPQPGFGTNHGISAVYIDSSADFRAAKFNSACISSGIAVLTRANPLQETQIEMSLRPLNAALEAILTNRVHTFKSVDGAAGTGLMDSDTVTADELCEALRTIFKRNFASIKVEVGQRKQ